MRYEKERVDASGTPFGMMGVELSMLPILPMVKCKVDKWTIKITDLRCLSEIAVDTFEKIFWEAATIDGGFRGEDSVTFTVSDEMADDKLQMVIDICMAVSFEASKRGQSCDGHLLVSGATRTVTETGRRQIDFHLIPGHQKVIYKLFCDGAFKDGVSLAYVAKEIAEETMKEFTNAKPEWFPQLS